MERQTLSTVVDGQGCTTGTVPDLTSHQQKIVGQSIKQTMYKLCFLEFAHSLDFCYCHTSRFHNVRYLPRLSVR